MCALSKRVLQSLDCTVNSVLMKLFESSNTAIIEQCSYRRFEKFLANAASADNVFNA